MHWFSHIWDGFVHTFMHVKLHVHKEVVVGANSHLIYNVLIDIAFRLFFIIS